ncbi:M20 family metallopeptidase [Mesorhizobium sp. Root172]|uniref:M20 family metallopeptidase n=1 Tax=Mesorhizobium sp. Root172 TaxID=1736481 RepID=UPI0006FE020F|nr:M20 family metallopeptidase [Mesorhizobium sp. Root172]KRB29696.1 peptidase M20 [Mesorhizobium sp. Root172]
MDTLSEEQSVLAYLDGQRGPMLGLLRDLVDIDSPSRNKAGVDAVGARLVAFLRHAGIAEDMVPNDVFGSAFAARLPGRSDRGHVLLMGHMDTVFPVGEAARRPFRVEGGRAYGPGVADMKGGLVVNAFAMAALARHFTALCPIIGLFTADEEIASPSSRALIERQAMGARAVFNSEPGRANGNVVVARKGGVFMRFDVRGKASHSGAAFSDGISAVEEVAHKVIALHALTNLDDGVTVNVGVIGGGQTLNTVAPAAFGELDLRYVRSSDRDKLLAAIRGIIDTSWVPGASAELLVTGEFLPLGRTQAGDALYELYKASAADVGHHIGAESTGGCADSGYAAATGAPTLCGTGPLGGNVHTAAEYIDIETLVPRAKALALSIMRSMISAP